MFTQSRKAAMAPAMEAKVSAAAGATVVARKTDGEEALIGTRAEAASPRSSKDHSAPNSPFGGRRTTSPNSSSLLSPPATRRPLPGFKGASFHSPLPSTHHGSYNSPGNHISCSSRSTSRSSSGSRHSKGTRLFFEGRRTASRQGAVGGSGGRRFVPLKALGMPAAAFRRAMTQVKILTALQIVKSLGLDLCAFGRALLLNLLLKICIFFHFHIILAVPCLGTPFSGTERHHFLR